MKKFLEIAATKEGRKMAKEAFRKLYKKHKAEVARTKKTKGAVPTIDYRIKKADLKTKIKGTRLITKADIKAKPGLRRRILINIEKSKRAKPKNKPIIFGKAYASDKVGKTMQVPPLTAAQRKLMKKEMAEAADRGYKRVRKRALGFGIGGNVKTVRTVAKKLEKASKAHAGQAKKLNKIVKKYI